MKKVSKSLFLNYTAITVLILTLVGYPLVAPISVVLGIENRLVSVPFRALVLFLSLFVVTKGVLLRDRFPSGPFWLAWWIFWGLYISRIIMDGFLNPEVLRLSLSEYLLYAIGMSLLPALALSIKLDDSILERTLIGIIIFGSLGAVLNIWLITSQRELMTVSALIAERPESDTLNPIGLAHLGVTVLILSAWMLVRVETRGLMKHILLIICFLIGAGSVLTGASRGPLLTLVLTLPVITYMAFKNLHNRNPLRLSVIIIAFFSGMSWLLVNSESILALGRMQESLFSDDARMGLFAAGLNLFLNNPILGAGTEPLGFYPHNVIIESFLLSGVFSGLLFVTIVVISLLASIKIFFRYPRISWVSLLYLQYLMGAMVSGALYDNAMMWTLMVLVVICRASLRAEKSVVKSHERAMSSLLPPVGRPIPRSARMGD